MRIPVAADGTRHSGILENGNPARKRQPYNTFSQTPTMIISSGIQDSNIRFSFICVFSPEMSEAYSTQGSHTENRLLTAVAAPAPESYSQFRAQVAAHEFQAVYAQKQLEQQYSSLYVNTNIFWSLTRLAPTASHSLQQAAC